MEMTARLQILGLMIVVAWTRTGSAQMNCSNHSGIAQSVNASTLYAKTIVSPNYPNPYGDNLWCEWKIAYNDPEYILKVVFNDFTLEDDLELNLRGKDRCQDTDKLEFKDGSHYFSNLLGRYCGTFHPEVIYTTGQFMYVNFHTDRVNSQMFKGFNFSFLAVKKEEGSAICREPWMGPEISRLNGSSGTFFTPDYPVPYRHQETCVWTITVPAFKRVKLTFETFELSTTFRDCPRHSDGNDYVVIRDGLTHDNFEIGRFCENNAQGLPPAIYSIGRNMYVRFRAFGPEQRKDGKGFKSHFEAVDQPADINSTEVCFPGNVNNNNLRLTGDKGTLKSPLDLYPPDMNCSWLITVPVGKLVELIFTSQFYMSGPGDYVELLDGRYTSGKSVIKKLSGVPEGTFRSSDRYMTVYFRSDSDDYHRYSGFRATFKAVDDGSVLKIALAVGISVVVLILIIVCFVCIAKHRKSPNREAGDDRIPMTTAPTSAANTTQPSLPPPRQEPYNPADNSVPTPPVGYAPVPTKPPLPPPEYPKSPPPPYPGSEEAPQYSLPGQ